MKSDRLKKIEIELEDLKQWLRLGLVPKKDLDKHKKEINILEVKLEEEIQRLKFLKENGEVEEFVAPKKNLRPSFSEGQTLPDISIADDTAGLTDVGVDMQTDSTESETTIITEKDEEEETSVDGEDENPFSDENRWRRGIIDPDADDNW